MRTSAFAILALAALGLAACLPQLGTGDDPPAGATAGASTAGALDRQTAEVHRQLAAGLEAAGQPEAALAELEAALASDSRAATAERKAADQKIAAYGLTNRSYEELARLCERNDPPAQAVRACTLVIADFKFSSQRLPEFLSDRGDAYAALDDLARAAKDYSTALEIDSGFSRALLGRARVRVEQGELGAAAADYRSAIGAGLGTPAIRTERAEVLMADGQYRAATGEYDRILSDPELAEAHGPAYRGRAMAHCSDGQAEAAAVDWQVWQAGDPEEDGAALVVPLVEGGYLAADSTETPLESLPNWLAALRAWTEAGCPIRDPTSPEEAAAPGAKPGAPATEAPVAELSDGESPAAPAPEPSAPNAAAEAPADETPADETPAPESPAVPAPAEPPTDLPQTGTPQAPAPSSG